MRIYYHNLKFNNIINKLATHINGSSTYCYLLSAICYLVGADAMANKNKRKPGGSDLLIANSKS